MGTDHLPTASVVICAHTMDRWQWLREAVDSAQRQTAAPAQLIVVVDHNQALYQRLADTLTDTQVIRNAHTRGLSGARNTGVAAAHGEVIAFLDDDARAREDWLETQLRLYDDPRVLAVGGRVDPLWVDGRPGHFPAELDWIIGCSYRGLPLVAAEVRNVIGANMSFRRDVFEWVGLFDDRVGRTEQLRGGEETDLCIRSTTAVPEGRIVYEPASRVSHHVPAGRTTVGYMLTRAWGEGTSKALISRPAGSRRHLSSERRYVRRVLPRAVVREARAADRGGIASAGTILAVFGATCLGYATERARSVARRRVAGSTA